MFTYTWKVLVLLRWTHLATFLFFPSVFFCSHRSLDLTGPLFLGGVPNLPENFPFTTREFIGCMKDLHIDNRPVDMAGFIANNGTLPGVWDCHIHYHSKVWSKNFRFKKIFKWWNYDLLNLILIQESQFPKKILSGTISKQKKFSTFITIRNIYWAANQHIRMISEGSCDTEDLRNGC